METIKIDKIIIKDNIRKDYGELTEMTASLKEHGMRKPVELNKRNELVDGFRRIKAAKAAGMEDIPYFYNDDKIDNTTEQILSGIFSKNLNTVEEGQAFVKYMAEHKILIKELAIKLSKTEGYVQKRIEIATLPKEITDEIVAGRLEIGHALLLKKMPEPEAKKFMKTIIQEKWHVEEARDRLQYEGGGKISEAPFNKEQCKGCKFNGSEQSELFETGKILNGVCMNKGCYAKKMSDYVKDLREKYKDVIVDKVPAGYIRSDSYEAKERGLTKAYMDKCRETKENYAVMIDDSYAYGIHVNEYFKPKAKKESAKSKEGIREETPNAKDEVREQKLETRIEQFKSMFLIGKCKETIVPWSKEAKALAMIEMNPGIEVKKAFSMTEKEIDKKIAESSLHALMGMGLKNLIIATENNGVDIKKHFVITEEFLKIHTKDQLLSLMKELKIKSDVVDESTLKKEDLIRNILDDDIKGKIPKSMQ